MTASGWLTAPGLVTQTLFPVLCSLNFAQFEKKTQITNGPVEASELSVHFMVEVGREVDFSAYTHILWLTSFTALLSPVAQIPRGLITITAGNHHENVPSRDKGSAYTAGYLRLFLDIMAYSLIQKPPSSLLSHIVTHIRSTVTVVFIGLVVLVGLVLINRLVKCFLRQQWRLAARHCHFHSKPKDFILNRHSFLILHDLLIILSFSYPMVFGS